MTVFGVKVRTVTTVSQSHTRPVSPLSVLPAASPCRDPVSIYSSLRTTPDTAEYREVSNERFHRPRLTRQIVCTDGLMAVGFLNQSHTNILSKFHKTMIDFPARQLLTENSKYRGLKV